MTILHWRYLRHWYLHRRDLHGRDLYCSYMPEIHKPAVMFLSLRWVLQHSYAKPEIEFAVSPSSRDPKDPDAKTPALSLKLVGLNPNNTLGCLWAYSEAVNPRIKGVKK